jgi:putative transposase
VTKAKATFPTYEAVRKLVWLAHQDIARKWSMSLPNWALILNHLAIRFEVRMPL